MKNQFLFFILTFSFFSAFTQENKELRHTKYKNLDSVIQFQDGVTEYSFLWSKLQGFHWDTISQKTDCRFNIRNDTKDTIFIKYFGNDGYMLQYNRDAFHSLNDRYGSLGYAIFPGDMLTWSVHLMFKSHIPEFQEDFKIEYFMGDARKIFRIPTWGSFIKAEDKPIESEIRNKETYSLELVLPVHKTISDLVFIRWNGNREEKYFPIESAENTYKFMVKIKPNDSLIYGMFFCERYQVINKVKLELPVKNGNLKIYVNHLFETRNDYFYSSYDTHGGKVITPKLPFNSQLKLYKLSWSNPKHTKGTDSIIAYHENIKRYLDSLGYNSVDRIYEPNKSKAIKLEQELKNSKYHISMLPYEFSDSVLSRQDWTSVYYNNTFEIRFSNKVSDQWVKTLFKKYQISDFKKSERDLAQVVYFFSFKYIVSRSYMRILDKIWQLKEVELIEQKRTTQEPVAKPW